MQMSLGMSEVHRFRSLFAAQAFVAALRAAQKSYRIARVARPTPGYPPYMVIIYG
jgi:hypothetical protein